MVTTWRWSGAWRGVAIGAAISVTLLLSSCSSGGDSQGSEGSPGNATGSGPDQAALTALACEATGTGTAYEVGPDEKLKTLGEVPWESLVAGDTVRIHWRDQAYREKFMLRGQGTQDQPIVVCGVAGSNGELPIIDGKDAVSKSGLPYPSEAGQARGLIHVTLGKDDPWGYKPKHIVIQGLHIRNAYYENSFTSSSGKKAAYLENAAGIFIERGENITVRGVVIEGNGNGFFVASGDSEEVLSREILLERSRIHGNGTVKVSADRHHNIYTAAAGMVFQFNDIGPLRDGSGGGALKDRSAGTVIRYNRIDGGARTLDLIDAEDSFPVVGELPEYRTTLVYGNLLIAGPGGASNMVHYGGDSGVETVYRKGTLYFYHNTVVVRADQQGPQARYRTSLFDASTSEETIDARNNIIVVESGTPGSTPTEMAWMRDDGNLKLGVNWATPGMFKWRDDSNPPAKGSISGLDKVKGDKDGPGFIDEAGGDFALASGSSAAGMAEPLPGVLVKLGAAVDFEYVHPAAGKERSDATDMGAFSSGGSAVTVGGNSGGGSAGGGNSGGTASGGQSGASRATASGQAKADGWSGSLQFLGKGPNGYDNGKKSACTGAGAGSPSVLCVKSGGNGRGTAAAPFGSINAALAAAKAGDIVQVAQGKYSENVAIGKLSDPAATDVNLLGGFSDDFSSRDASKFRSVIDGKGSNPALQLHLQSRGKSVVDGFRITNGRGLGDNSDNGNGRGGGVYVEMIGGGEVLISHNEIFGNKTNGKEDEARGGGIYTNAADWDGSKSTIRIEDNVVHSNEAGRGAGITVVGRHAVILRNIVEANKAHGDHGGGVYVSTANSEVTDNVVRGNEIGATVKYGYGGGIIIPAAQATLRGNVFTGNYAPTNGSGVFWDEGAKGTMTEDLLFANGCPSEPRDGVALYVDGGEGPSIVTIDHVTIANHICPDAAPNGAAIFVEDQSSLTVKNSIIWGNTKEFATNLKGKYTVANSLTNESGSGNKKGDPQFVDPAKGDFHLKQGSPAIGSGTSGSNMGTYPK